MPAGSASLQRTFTASALATIYELAQAEALELPGRGARQLAHDPDLPRPLVGRQRALQEPPHVRPQRLRLRGRIAGHDEHEGLDEAAGFLRAHDPAVEHARVPQQHRFYRDRGHPLPGHLEEVVLAATVDVGTVRLSAIHVAGPEPVAHERPARMVE